MSAFETYQDVGNFLKDIGTKKVILFINDEGVCEVEELEKFDLVNSNDIPDEVA